MPLKPVRKIPTAPYALVGTVGQTIKEAAPAWASVGWDKQRVDLAEGVYRLTMVGEAQLQVHDSGSRFITAPSPTIFTSGGLAKTVRATGTDGTPYTLIIEKLA